MKNIKRRDGAAIAVADHLADIQCVSVKVAENVIGLGHTKICEEIKFGRLESIKVGARRLVTVSGMREWKAHYLKLAEVRSVGGSEVPRTSSEAAKQPQPDHPIQPNERKLK